MRILTIGEVLWDVFGKDERLGGAPLNVAVAAARLGHETAVVSGVGDDERGERARQALRDLGVSDAFLATVPGVATGTAVVQVDASGGATFRFERPAAYDRLPESLTAEAVAWHPDWVVFGTLAQTEQQVREMTERILAAVPSAGRLYDANLRDGAYTAELVRELLSMATLVKLNEAEATIVAGTLDLPPEPLEAFTRSLVDVADLHGVCVTRGADGAALLFENVFAEAAAERVDVVDTVGAGDAFSAALVHGVHAGAEPREILHVAVRVAALVVGRKGATPDWLLDDKGSRA